MTEIQEVFFVLQNRDLSMVEIQALSMRGGGAAPPPQHLSRRLKRIRQHIEKNLADPEYSYPGKECIDKKTDKKKTSKVNLNYKSRYKPTNPFDVTVTINMENERFCASFFGDVSYKGPRRLSI